MRNVTAVAHASAARTKNCQGWSDWSGAPLWSAGALVDVAELIVEAFVECWVDGSSRFLRWFGVMPPRPPHRRQSNHRDSTRPHEIWHEPGETVESFVDRRGEPFLAAV